MVAGCRTRKTTAGWLTILFSVKKRDNLCAPLFAVLFRLVLTDRRRSLLLLLRRRGDDLFQPDRRPPHGKRSPIHLAFVQNPGVNLQGESKDQQLDLPPTRLHIGGNVIDPRIKAGFIVDMYEHKVIYGSHRQSPCLAD